MEAIKIKIGDTVIRRDGLKGKIVKSIPENKFELPNIEAEILYENGRTGYVIKEQFNNFYRIGYNVFGNKDDKEIIEALILDCEERIQAIKKERTQLRKQLWRINDVMVEDWRERHALRELRQKTKISTDLEEE